MDTLDKIDIELLFDSVVLMPQDRANTVNKKVTEVKHTPASSQPNLENATPKETVPTIHPFIILTTPQLKTIYQEENSSFQKIIKALHIPSAKKYLHTDLALLGHAHQYQCIWCIGIPSDQEQEAQQSNHPNLLISPDILNLKTKAEKIAMYNPLKAFVEKNKPLIDQL